MSLRSIQNTLGNHRSTLAQLKLELQKKRAQYDEATLTDKKTFHEQVMQLSSEITAVNNIIKETVSEHFSKLQPEALIRELNDNWKIIIQFPN